MNTQDALHADKDNIEIKTVVLVGAGAVGSYFVWGLSDKPGINLLTAARGERAQRLKKEGIFINKKNYRLKVCTPEEARGADLILITTKYTALPKILPDISKMTADRTIVMSLLNGVDSEEIVGREIGPEHMVFSMMKIVSQRAGNKIFFDGPSTPGVFFGEKNGRPGGRTSAIAALFDGTPINYHISQNIISDIWSKFIINISRNLPQAIISCGAGAYEDSEHVKFIAKKMREEVVAVAAAKGIDLSAGAEAAARMTAADKSARYSTLQDLDASRPTEIDMFSGAMIKMGAETGVPTPYNEYTYHLIKALEEKNAGKFNY